MIKAKHIPIKIFWKQDELRVKWIDLGEKRFVEPFFEDTISRCRTSSPAQFVTETGVDELLQYSSYTGIFPTGFIFHMSRCGSTLVAQMLTASEKNIVLAEAPPIDDILRLAGLEEEQRGELLKAVINLLAQKRHPDEERLFIKFDSWSIFHLPFILKVFPDVSWMFLYRDPLEVMVSHERKKGMQVVPGLLPPEIFGLDSNEIKSMRFYEYGATVLHSICYNALENYQNGSKGVLINYNQLPDVMTSLLTDHFKVTLDSNELHAMQSASKINTKKSMKTTFKSDSADKKISASKELIELATSKLYPIYNKLEKAST